jgi:superfamily II DNA or RNA helicase/very-short-patch-repair endonuclease
MVRNIDDLADERTRGIQTIGERYYDQFLRGRPKGEWSPYIDETAKDISTDIQISDLELDGENFGTEVGSYYRRGLQNSMGRYADLPTILDESVDDRQLGRLAYLLNELSHDVTKTGAGVEDVQAATEAVIEKLLTRHAGPDLTGGIEVTGGTVADIAVQLFKNETVAANIDGLLAAFEGSVSSGLLALIDEPQMMTPLWNHQREALAAWAGNGGRGYVDMATATGKTVLGLAAIALRYGTLHPADQDIETSDGRRREGGKEDILIVAHSELILEQWRREFDRHLNIPRERTAGADDITLEWGTVHFRTPQSLGNEDRVVYDLVLLDEAHHYATGSEWGQLLDAFEGDVLAMSGSVDDAGRNSERIKERLSNSVGPEVKRYTIVEAKADGIIPSFDWEVQYAPYDVVGGELGKSARRAERSFRSFRERLSNGELSAPTDRHLRTYEDVRRFSHTTEGNDLKQRDDEFRDLVTRLFSRRTKRWNLSPVLDAVVDLVVEHSTTEKVVVLADSNAQVEELDSQLEEILPDSTPVFIVSRSQDRATQRETIEEFDGPDSAGVLLGTGDLLGEGVDIQRASVAINMATGSVNPELVQRIGRVLRNPTDTPKHAMFYNVVGVPPSVESAVPREDGKRIIEQAAAFCALGGRFEKLPGFSTASALDQESFGHILQEGASFIASLDEQGDYDWEDGATKREDLTALLEAIETGDGNVDTILGAWEEYAWEHSRGDDTQETGAGSEEDAESANPTEVNETVRQRVVDIVRLQPAELADLKRKWGLASESAVAECLRSSLAEYHFRDDDGLVWASEAALALVDAIPDVDVTVDADIDTGGSPDRETPTGDGPNETSRPDETTRQEPSEERLLAELRRLRDVVGDVPTKGDLQTHGKVDIAAFEAVFGTWSDAVRSAGFRPKGSSRRQFTREEVLDGIRDVAEVVGRPPTTEDLNDHAPFSASVIYNDFDSLADARAVAGVDDVDDPSPSPPTAASPRDSHAPDEGGPDDPGGSESPVPPNSSVEYYELLRRHRMLVRRVLESEDTPYERFGDTPMTRWFETLRSWTVDGTDGGDGGDHRQDAPDPETLAEYRRVYGDEDTITDYQCVETARLSDDEIAALRERSIIGTDEQVRLPVSPETGTPLPVTVTSIEQLNRARQLLGEFPAELASTPTGRQADEESSDVPRQDPTSEPLADSNVGTASKPGSKSDREGRSPGRPNVNDRETTVDEDPEGDTPSVAGDESDSSVGSPDDGEQSFFWNREAGRIDEFDDEDLAETDAGSTGSVLDRKIDEWKSQLLDLTRRNNLVAFKPTKTKSLPFEGASPTRVARELAQGSKLYVRRREADADGEPVSVDASTLGETELLPTRVADEAADSLSQIGRHNKQYLRERGVDTLYLSLGMLRWYSVEHSDEANRSPLFLAPIELEEKTLGNDDRHNYVLKPTADGLRVNPALRKKLAAERGISLPADAALSLDEIDAGFESVYQATRGMDRWTLQDEVILGIFDFTKFGLYADLERNRGAIKSNPIVRALNGDMEPLQRVDGDINTPSAEELDRVVDPADVYQVLDADSSQQEAIEAAKRGKSFVLQGPPGTGKSQTIANIIAEKLAAGERVLFVSEKQAALDVVKNRLDDVGLGRFCLEVHGQKANSPDVLSSLVDELHAGETTPAAERSRTLDKLRQRRDALNQYGEQLFYSPDGWTLTAYQAFGLVSEYRDAPRVATGIDRPLTLDQREVDEGIDELETLARFEAELDTAGTGPWRYTTLRTWGIDTGDAMERSLESQVSALEDLIELADKLDSTLDVRPASLAEFRTVASVLQHVVARPDVTWQPALFEESFTEAGDRVDELAELERTRAELVETLTDRYERSFLSTDGAGLNDELAGYGLLKVVKPSYRSLRRRITNHARPEYDPDHEQLVEDTRMLAELQRLEAERDDYRGLIDRLGSLYEAGETDWETLTDARKWVADLKAFPAAVTDPVVEALVDGTLGDVAPLATRTTELLAQYDEAASFFERSMAVDEMTVGDEPFRRAPLRAVAERLTTLRAEIPKLQRRVQCAAQLEAVRETVCGGYVDNFLDSDLPGKNLLPAFKRQFYTDWLSAVYDRTDLGKFTADRMEQYVAEFRELDELQQELARREIQHEVTRRRSTSGLEGTYSAEEVLIRRESEKQRRHTPLRELFDEAGSFITQLTPCFMMSPLSVAQYLKRDSVPFDTVVFDEASQIMPQDAVSSLIRADQAIIAGDTKQLPPTSFFQSDVETTEDVREDLDSILEETAAVLPEKRLRWHYRSRTKELIEFSNYHYYNDSLRTFPENDPDVDTGVSFEYVPDGVYDRGGSRQNQVEAERVVDLITEHAEKYSDKSLGVVAFSSAQEQAIRDTVEERRADNAVLDAFVGREDVLDEFFIKNLEMVQGDERDRMLFSVGYGPDENGTISMNFGPLNKSGGERRLNVAVTRAKEQVTVVSSIQPGDIDLTRTKSTGVEHFKNYLEYAQQGERALARDDTVTGTLDFDSRFEEAVYDALEAEGYDVVSQVQSASYSIDLAIKHPDRPGKFVLGIECDGAAYHSSKTARDRDRTRQLVLENLGWTIHRIWSPDWASNRDEQLRKINERMEALLDSESV